MEAERRDLDLMNRVELFWQTARKTWLAPAHWP